MRPAIAIDTLVVGQGMPNRGWRNLADWGAVERVTVSYDSVYKWDVTPHGNLGVGALGRGGRLMATWEEPSGDSLVTVSRALPDLEYLLDGDASTAFDPDAVGAGNAPGEASAVPPGEVPRDLRISIDLGAAFGIGRVRLFPRLDRDHRLLFPQWFSLSTSDIETLEERYYTVLSPLNFGLYNPNEEPVVDRQFASRNARYLRLDVEALRQWEIAELEIYSDGTVPMGVYQSVPVPARHYHPVWGRVRYDGGDVTDLPVVIQTRTGPDRNPTQYFRRTGVGDDLEVVAAAIYNGIPPEEQGPVRPNPDWSQWLTVTDGHVRSPGLTRFLQFRVTFPEPGTVIRRLIFEYARPPLVQELQAEIDPRAVKAGQEESFALSVLTYNPASWGVFQSPTTGYRQLDVLTTADIAAVEGVLIDDQPVLFSTRPVPDGGFTVNLGQRIKQDGTFLQILFRGTVFLDGTRFEVRAADQRLVAFFDGIRSRNRLEWAYQTALEADVDPRSPGGELVVRLEEAGRSKSVLSPIAAVPACFTPNDDGINDGCRVSFDLLKLTRPSPVTVRVYDAAGRLVRGLTDAEVGNGHHLHDWDGRDREGQRVPPGVYIVRVRVAADETQESRAAVVGVAY